MRSKCRRCGACCLVVVLVKSRERLGMLAKEGHADAAFILANWRQISAEEAQEIKPYLRECELDDRTFWRCDHYDDAAKQCRVHNAQRPRVCRGYPWYWRKPSPETHARTDLGCAYRTDLAGANS